jgi:hypothetical protein
MALSEQDIELFAARIRLHFEPDLRDTAYNLALPLARLCGARIKALRPETTLAEIRGWVGGVSSAIEDPLSDTGSLDLPEESGGDAAPGFNLLRGPNAARLRRVMNGLIETARGQLVREELALRSGRTTFRQWVVARARARAASANSR